ncbi:MAG: F0F1 ATP synthase subunit A [Pirellulaceae bacterium]
MMDGLRIFDSPVVFSLGAIPVTETMLTSTAVSTVLLLLALGLRQALARRPQSTPATVAILTVQSFDHLVADILGRPHTIVATLAGSLFVFIAACNLAGQLPGVHPATASLATTSALAVVVFLAVPIAGVAERGLWGYLRHYFRPNPLLMPLHLISEVSRTLALSMRLFGNIMSGHLVVALLVALTGLIVPVPLMALDVLIGLLQAYIFSILATVYIGAAIGAGEE